MHVLLSAHHGELDRAGVKIPELIRHALRLSAPDSPSINTALALGFCPQGQGQFAARGVPFGQGETISDKGMAAGIATAHAAHPELEVCTADMRDDCIANGGPASSRGCAPITGKEKEPCARLLRIFCLACKLAGRRVIGVIGMCKAAAQFLTDGADLDITEPTKSYLLKDPFATALGGPSGDDVPVYFTYHPKFLSQFAQGWLKHKLVAATLVAEAILQAFSRLGAASAAARAAAGAAENSSDNAAATTTQPTVPVPVIDEASAWGKHIADISKDYRGSGVTIPPTRQEALVLLKDKDEGARASIAAHRSVAGDGKGIWTSVIIYGPNTLDDWVDFKVAAAIRKGEDVDQARQEAAAWKQGRLGHASEMGNLNFRGDDVVQGLCTIGGCTSNKSKDGRFPFLCMWQLR